MARQNSGQTGKRGKTGSTRPSISEVAGHAGVSIATVSRIVNGIQNKASAETIARVKSSIRELGYRPSGAGQALRRRESRLVAVIAANLANPVMAAIAASAETALREKGLVMVLCDSHDRPELQDEYLREMQAQSVRGLVMLSAVPSPALADILGAGEPVLFVNRKNPMGETPAFVGIDNRSAAAEVAENFLARGIRRPLLIHASLGSSATADRVAAFTERYRRATAAQVTVLGDDRLDHLELGYDMMRQHLDMAGTPPDAVFAMSDLIAYGASRVLHERGIDGVPIVGFDDNPLNDWIAPWLTSVRVPYARFGLAISEALESLWRDETGFSLCLPHELVLRPATRPPETPM
ncbi:LacI family DNA-binding transcriptional regulator [Tropicimonas sp. IMCC6043]|uniref:LacI family DNA-binding transcriptional regulator n=1 Tax=Tropicimonas sp. IMCC6043 TaxID=2510645 RepID=UPI00101D4186|nr:LacI family DNA-binding transcriptional regulator [Tropicimonas sp. IMCC6043]RYH07347.1 LacI family transcriptional regulator [Tropicimonas sp. IMCC6043]